MENLPIETIYTESLVDGKTRYKFSYKSPIMVKKEVGVIPLFTCGCSGDTLEDVKSNFIALLKENGWDIETNTFI